MKPQSPPPQAFRPGHGQVVPSLQPQPQPARVVQVVAAAALSANLALRRLYDGALAAYPYGPRSFAEAAYGPFPARERENYLALALQKVENTARKVIDLATPNEIQHTTALLHAGDLLEVLRFLLDQVHLRLIRENVLFGSPLKPVNAEIYQPPYVDPRVEKSRFFQEGGPKNRRLADRYVKKSTYKPVTGSKTTHLDHPTLTVSLNRNRVVLSNELCRQLGGMMRRDGFGDLHHGSRIELEPPRLGRASGPRCWYLDVRPTAPGRLTHTANTRPQFDSLRVLPRALFHAVARLPGEPASGSLKLQLVSGVPEVPGYYPLEVVGR